MMAGKKEKRWKRLKVGGAGSTQFFVSIPNVLASNILKSPMPPPRSHQRYSHQ